jgi:uncharacterized protein (DUF1684 family)
MSLPKLVTGLAAAMLLMTALGDTSYHAVIQKWRAQHELELKTDDGWLTVDGLFWLKEGPNTAGSDPSSAIALPRGPSKAGVFEFHSGKTVFRVAPGVQALVNGKPAGAVTPLKSDSDGAPDQVQVDSLTMYVIHRGARDGIRLKNPENSRRRSFAGLHWFPVQDGYRVTAKFVPYAKPKTITIPNILGETEQDASPGYVLFTLQGQSLRLDPVLDDKQLFFIFRDLTSGKETYPAGRFLYADPPKNGEVDLDFNKAENPPCAFTPYATCPLPPPQNRLALRIEAGELNYGHHR